MTSFLCPDNLEDDTKKQIPCQPKFLKTKCPCHSHHNHAEVEMFIVNARLGQTLYIFVRIILNQCIDVVIILIKSNVNL